MSIEVLYTKEQIQTKVDELGKKITQDYKNILEADEELIVLCVLRGAFIFCADLIRATNIPLKLDFITLSSYENNQHSKGVVEIKCTLRENVTKRHVLIVEDIIDSGITMDFLKKHLQTLSPKSVRLASFLSKPTCAKITHKIDYLCFEVANDFVIGYGLDDAGLYRQLPYLGKQIK